MNGIRIAAVLGSVRPGNWTGKALDLVVGELRRRDVPVDVIDPATLSLPPPGAGDSPDAERLRELVRNATGVVLATPEYHGSFSSVMKLVIENLGFPSVLAGKPVAVLGVAAGAIGAIKSIEHLKGVVSHVGGLALPGSVSIANVQQGFDATAEKRLRSVATGLLDYIHGAVCPRITLEAMARGAV